MKKHDNESVLHDWVCALPFTQQALLILALRGPDGLPKESTAKCILHFMRGVVLKPAYPSFDGSCDGFMRTNYTVNILQTPPEQLPWDVAMKRFFKDTDQYPMHFLMHLFHAAEVIAYNHPLENIRHYWWHFYMLACNSLHMVPETKEHLNERLKL